MDRETFERRIRWARNLVREGTEGPDYWRAYQRGLHRRFFRDAFGTDEMHTVWMSMAKSQDLVRAAKGRGYRDGYIPEFCPNDGDCHSCSLVSSGRDCQNNPL